MKNIYLIILCVVCLFSCVKEEDPEVIIERETVSDIDENIYETVVIGSQTWMAENLKVTRYSDGTRIPLIEDNKIWAELGENNTDWGYCYFNNNANGEKDIYGALYTFGAAVKGEVYHGIDVIQGVCPDGWHIPDMEEWMELVNFIDSKKSGDDLKEGGLWEGGEGDLANELYFSALPGGFRYLYDGEFKALGREANWWSSGQNTEYDGLAFSLYSSSSSFHAYKLMGKSYGLSVRCIKDSK